MNGYAKIFSSIFVSSIWTESVETKLLWMSMLVMSDGGGYVGASIGGLARLVGITRDQCEEGLNILMSPDPDSRDGTSGERIVKSYGGWTIVNHALYRGKQSCNQTPDQVKAAEKNRLRRQRHRALQDGDNLSDVGDVYVDACGDGPEMLTSREKANERQRRYRARKRESERDSLGVRGGASASASASVLSLKAKIKTQDVAAREAAEAVLAAKAQYDEIALYATSPASFPRKITWRPQDVQKLHDVGATRESLAAVLEWLRHAIERKALVPDLGELDACKWAGPWVAGYFTTLDALAATKPHKIGSEFLMDA